MKRITAMYFSPTGTTKKITGAIAASLADAVKGEIREVDLTEWQAREQSFVFDEADILVFGYPVYAGRVPQTVQEVMSRIQGNRAPAIPVAVYGNRDYEDALIEGVDLFMQRGCQVPAAAAFIGEHSYSDKVAAGRPDASDLDKAKIFGQKIAEKIESGDFSGSLSVKGNRPYKDPMPDMPFAPETTQACTNCGLCAQKCPMGVIDPLDAAKVDSAGCILCCACVKICPVHGKILDEAPIRKIRNMLETKFTQRKEPEWFL